MSEKKPKIYRELGVKVTIGWLAILVIYCLFMWRGILSMRPNEFGDFLAGALGPLAILWLVLGFWQQGDELRNSVDALNLQSEELRASVEQQAALVEVTKQQVTTELHALKEEREARRVANLPRLRLSSSGGMSSGANLVTNLRLDNLGMDCTDLEVRVHDDDSQLVSTATLLPSSGVHTFQIKHTTESHLDFFVELAFRSRDGELISETYRAVRDNPKQVGFLLTKIT